MKKSSFRVKRKTATEALRYLNQVKSKHSKVLNIVHKRLEIATYFTGNDMRVTECKFLFALRSRMIDIRANNRDNKLGHYLPLLLFGGGHTRTPSHLPYN